MKTVWAAIAAIITALALATPAQASTGICSALDRAGSVSSGVAALELIALSSDNPERDGEKITEDIINTCPQHIPVLSAFVQKWG